MKLKTNHIFSHYRHYYYHSFRALAYCSPAVFFLTPEGKKMAAELESSHTTERADEGMGVEGGRNRVTESCESRTIITVDRHSSAKVCELAGRPRTRETQIPLVHRAIGRKRRRRRRLLLGLVVTYRSSSLLGRCVVRLLCLSIGAAPFGTLIYYRRPAVSTIA